MPDPVIRVEQLSKTYVVPVRGSGLAAAFKSLVHRQTRAVEQISLRVEPAISERVMGRSPPTGIDGALYG